MRQGTADRALLYARTIRHLTVAQLAHRIRIRGQRAALGAAPGVAHRMFVPRATRRGAWPEGFVPLDGRLEVGWPSAKSNAEGRFRFLEDERALGSPPDWLQTAASQLWRYHLHYFEWAWSFAQHPEIANGPNDAVTEVTSPNTIYNHARCQGIGGINESIRKFQASASLGKRLALLRTENLNEAPRCFFPQVVRLTADFYANVGRLLSFCHCVQERVHRR